MLRLILSGLLLGLTATASADEKPKDGAKPAFNPAKLVGKWNYVSGSKAGDKLPADHLLGPVTFTKDRITILAGGDMKFVMAYKLDTKTTPVSIDMEIKEGPVNEGKAKGIVAIEGEQLKICYQPTGGDRPKKFEANKDNGAHYFVLKRAK